MIHRLVVYWLNENRIQVELVVDHILMRHLRVHLETSFETVEVLDLDYPCADDH